MRDGTIYSVYNTSLTALKAEQQFWQFARLNRNYLVNAKNAVEFDRKRNVIWMQDGQRIRCKKDAISDILMLVVAEHWHDYGEINEEDVENLQKWKNPTEAVDAPAPVGLFVTIFIDIMQIRQIDFVYFSKYGYK